MNSKSLKRYNKVGEGKWTKVQGTKTQSTTIKLIFSDHNIIMIILMKVNMLCYFSCVCCLHSLTVMNRQTKIRYNCKCSQRNQQHPNSIDQK